MIAVVRSSIFGARLAVTRPLVVAAGLVAVVGCSQGEPQHAPLVDTCPTPTECTGLPPVGQGTMSSSGGSSGAGGAAGGGGLSAGSLSGTVVNLVDDTFRTALLDPNAAVVEATGASGGIVSANWNGVDPFSLSGVAPAVASWVSVRPVTGNVSLRTLTPIATNLASTVALGLVQSDVIDTITLSLSTPSSRALGTAQVVFWVSSKTTGQGVSGVKLALSGATFVAYRVAGLWSVDDVATDVSGLAMLGNLPAPAYPGAPTSVSLAGATSGTVSVTVAADAVTFVPLQISL